MSLLTPGEEAKEKKKIENKWKKIEEMEIKKEREVERVEAATRMGKTEENKSEESNIGKKMF